MMDIPGKESVYVTLEKAIRRNDMVTVQGLVRCAERVPARGVVLKWTALMMAASSGKIKIAQWLIAEGADVHKKTQHGHAPLLLAARNGHTEMVCLLLDSGADVNTTGEEGATPLMIAAGAGDEGMLNLLLERGARTGLRDARGHDAESFAEQAGRTNVAERLRELRTSENHESAIKKHERLKNLARKASVKRGPRP